MELLCLAAAILAALVALLATPAVRAAALRAGFVDRPGERKIHREPVAYGGGVAVAIALAAALAAAGYAWYRLRHDGDLRAWRLWLGLATSPDEAPLLRGVGVCLGGAAGALLLGLADDKWKLSPLAKLAGQFVLAIAVVAGGVRITALVGNTLPMQAATVLWIVLVTNSFNLLDNMDGLCSGTVAIGAAVLAVVASSAGQAPVALALSALAGACIGFMRYNRAPARIFLGDAGSMACGFLMATLTVLTTYYHYHESPLSVGVPFLILAIPLYDTASVIVIRLRAGRKIWHGDTSHFSHRLVDLGMTQRQAVVTIHLAALAIALPAAVIPRLSTNEGLLVVGQAVLILTLIAMLERAGALKAKREKDAGDGGDV